jgi:DNA relaxase NicK
MEILVDYLTFTSKIDRPASLVELLGLKECAFVYKGGHYGYSHSMAYEGIKIYYDDKDGSRDDVCVEMSGKGCRTVELISGYTFDWLGLFKSIKPCLVSKEMHVSRLDVSCDVKDKKYFDFDKLYKYVREDRYICKGKQKRGMEWAERNIMLGSPKSDRRLRIYDKALEQGLKDVDWIRLEFQLRNETALSFILNWLNTDDIGDCYCGVMRDYLMFTKEKVDKENNHQNRATPARWWVSFLNEASKLKQIYLPKQEYTIFSAESYFERNCASTLKLLVEAYKGDISKIQDYINKAVLSKKQLSALERMNLFIGVRS